MGSMSIYFKNSTGKIGEGTGISFVWPPELFHELVERIGPRIQKQDSFWRKSLEPGLRITITLRYMAAGDSYLSTAIWF